MYGKQNQGNNSIGYNNNIRESIRNPFDKGKLL